MKSPSPPHDPAATLLRSILALGRRLRAERPPGSLSLSGLGILGTLQRHGTLVATRLAVLERLRPQSLTRLLLDLQREQLIERRRSPIDRREIEISMTPIGRQALMEDLTVRRAWLEAAMVAALSGREREILLAASSILSKLATYEAVCDDGV